MTDEQIEALPFYQRSTAFDEKEKATLLYAERITRGGSRYSRGYSIRAEEAL